MGRAVMTAGVILTATALGAGATAAGLGVQRRAVRRLRLRPDPHAGEPFGSVRGDPVSVRADDGTRLYAEIDGADRTDLAVVFTHGWTLTQDAWHFQRKALRGLGRLVFWDLRGHGRSDGGDRDGYDLPRLALDLAAVLDQTVPAGTPVVLVGHSMGAMTIMCYADRYPDEIGRRVPATALLNTSSGGLGEFGLRLPATLSRLTHRLLPRALRAAGAGAPLIERVRHLGRDGTLLIEDRVAFGPDAGPAAVAFAGDMAADTRMNALVDYFRVMITTETISECTALGKADTLVLASENDVLTPVEHALRIATRVPSAHLEIIPDVGHMAMLERPAAVNAHLEALIRRVGPPRRG